MIKYILPFLFCILCSVFALTSFHKIGKFNNDVWIKNPDNILTNNEVENLNRYLKSSSYLKSHVFNLKSNKFYPYHFGVLLKKTSDDYDNGYYSEEFFNYVGLGNKDVNNGVLLSIYLEDEDVNFVIGKGLDSDDLSYDDMEDIIDSGVDWIFDDTYYGVSKMIQKTIDKLIINGKVNYKWSIVENIPKQNNKQNYPYESHLTVFLSLIFLFLIFIYLIDKN